MISERLKNILLKELGLDNYDFQNNTVAGQVPGWDSLNHVKIISAVEKEYNLRFTMKEIMRLKNLGSLQEYIDKRDIR